MGEYRLTPAAKNDIVDIWNFTVESWGASQEEKYLLHIESQLDRLADNPSLGRHRPEIREGYNSFPVKKHVVYYLKGQQHIQIIGVLHGRMDVDAQLLG